MLAVPALALGAEKSFRDQLIEKLISCEYSLEVVMSDPETAIPAEVLREAKGVVLVHQYRAGFIIGGQGGSAVLVARNPQSGKWGVPVFLDPGGINFGLQAGVKEINSVFLLMSEQAVTMAYSGRFDIGADAVAVAGPNAVERERFDLFNAPVLVYSSSGGLFAGASFKTAWLAPFDRANRELYNTTHATPEIALSTWFQPPPEAQSLLTRLRAAEGGTSRYQLRPGRNRADSF
ncbi:MAG: lipid-binding SYLF domain-containing protein, partial [Opitutaceae bacterium]